MPRRTRTISNLGIYYIMIREINKEQIFKKETYIIKLKEIIKEIIDEVEFYVIAYCIMNNHMYLLIKAEVNELTKAMKKLSVKYAIYYNYSEKNMSMYFKIDLKVKQ